MGTNRGRLVSVILCSLVLLPVYAQDAEMPVRRGSDPVGVTVADQPSESYRFETHYMDSRDGQRHYRIQLAIPRRARAHEPLAALYMLDGNAAMDTLKPQDLESLADGTAPVLVALGHDVPTRTDAAARAYDYTPPLHGKSSGAPAPVVLGHAGGGADEFLHLLVTRIMPLVHSRVAVDDSRSTLWGHSYGGLFVIYALMKQPELFRHYVAGDPSLWWHHGEIRDHWRDADKNLLAGKRLAILTGTRPRARPAPYTLEAARYPGRPVVDPLAILMEIISGAASHGLHLSYQALPQYGHGEMLACSLRYALGMMSESALR
ncbi:MAG: alpha/beta hydrolase-fold protein [Castellaniella sp.]